MMTLKNKKRKQLFDLEEIRLSSLSKIKKEIF